MERSQVSEALNQEFARFEWRYQPPLMAQPMVFGHFAELYDFVEKQLQFWAAHPMPITQDVRAFWDTMRSRLDYLAGPTASQPRMAEHMSGAFFDLQKNDWPNTPADSLLAVKAIACPYPDDVTRWHGFLAGALRGINPNRTANMRQPQEVMGFMEGVAFAEPQIVSAFLGNAHEELRKQFEIRSVEAEKLQKRYGELAQNLENQNKENKVELEKWRLEKVQNLDAELNNLRGDFRALKDLYTEKLKLEAPAQYWKARATRMRWAGLGWLIFSVIFFVAIGWVLWNNFIAPSTFVDAKELASQVTAASAGKDSLLAYFSSAKNIRSLVGFSVLASLYFFVLRMLIRLTISSFHLSLDAAEREQLTYVYLALIEKGQNSEQKLIQDADRTVILQSLFSRADTGLLAGDSSPTMPGADVAALLKGGKS